MEIEETASASDLNTDFTNSREGLTTGETTINGTTTAQGKRLVKAKKIFHLNHKKFSVNAPATFFVGFLKT